MSNHFFENININLNLVNEFNININKFNLLFDNSNDLEQNNILENLIDYHKYYDINNYYIIFEFIILKIINNYDKFKNILKIKLLKLLCELKYSTLLYKLNFIYIDKNILFNLVNFTASKCSFSNFTYIFEKYINNTKLTKNNIIHILCKSFYNIDDRIYKYLLTKYIHKYTIEKQDIIKIISTLSNLKNPVKYILRKIKNLSNYINFNNFIDIIIHDFNNIQIIYNIHKYYYNKSHNFNTILDIFNSNYDIIYYNKIYDLLLSEEEKYAFILILKLKYNIILNNIEFKNIKLLNKIIINNYKYIIILLSNNNIYNNMNIITILKKNNLINLFFEKNQLLINSNNFKLLLFTKFLKIYNNDNIKIITINMILHKFRILFNKKYKNKIIEHNLKFFYILKELLNYEPNIKIPVLSNGSINYQYKQQQFNNNSPTYLLPYELNNYNKFILREKINGIITNIIPLNIFPSINYVNIKAEYIEELDLYLIIDINIPNTTIVERYNILRDLHPYTKNLKITNLNNINDFYNIARNEKININKFITENNNIINKWYPKFICYSNSYKNKNIINDILLNNNSDELLLTPLNKLKEIIIKPLNLITIKLLYLNNNWYDEEFNIYNNFIENTLLIQSNFVYECKIKFNNNNIYYIPIKIIYNNNPDKYNFINTMNNIIKHDWQKEYYSF
jgi:hypothetical protein